MTDLNLPMDVIQPEPPQPLITDQLEPQAPYPVAALGPILAPAALAAQGHANVSDDGREIPISLSCLTVAESGDRKSGTDRQALLPHNEHQKVLIQEYKAELKKYQDLAKKDPETPHPKPALPYILVEEPTIEGLQKSFLKGQSSMGLFSDEGAQLFGGYAMKPENLAKTSAALSKFWDGAPINRIRAKEDESASRYGCRLTVHMMMQPVIAKDVLTNPVMLGQGLLARCLLCWPESLAGTRFYQETNLNTDPHVGRYRQRMTELLQTTPQPPEGEDEPPRFNLSVSRAAKALWVSEYNRIESQLGRLGDLNSIKAVGSKAAEQVLRIAGVLAIVEAKQEIDSDTMSCAIELGQWYLGEALRLCYPAQPDPDLVAAQKLIDWIHSKGWTEFDRNRLGKSGPTFARSAKQRDKLLAILHKARHLMTEDGKSFRINSLIVADSADSAETQQIRGFPLAEDLRMTAEDLRKSQTSAENPQASAKYPQPETRVNTELPQNPQFPQSSESENLQPDIEAI